MKYVFKGYVKNVECCSGAKYSVVSFQYTTLIVVNDDECVAYESNVPDEGKYIKLQENQAFNADNNCLNVFNVLLSSFNFHREVRVTFEIDDDGKYNIKEVEMKNE